MAVLGRIPLIALGYEQREIAVDKELIVNYSNGKVYIVNPDPSIPIYNDDGSINENRYFDMTKKIADYLNEEGIDISADNIYVMIDGQKMDLQQAIDNIREGIVEGGISSLDESEASTHLYFG